MRRNLLRLLLAVLPLFVPMAICQGSTEMLAIGSPIPAFSLSGTDGTVHKVNDWKESPVLIVAFLCNHCTESQVYESRLNQLSQRYGGQGVAVVAIHSSNPKAVTDSDLAWTDVGDSLADMKERVAFRKIKFPYLYDGDSGSTARAFGAIVAPSIFIFDKSRKLRYSGRIDSDPANGPSTVHYASDAVEEMLAGKAVTVASTAAAGCQLRLDAVNAVRPAPDAGPVEVTLASAEMLTSLRQNPTGKLLLVNLYATWCGPCVSEFPDLMATNRMYRGRAFAFTTVSSNTPEEKPEVLAFLKKMNATTNNMLYGTDDTYAMQAAFDPNVGSAVPISVLISPSGEILFNQQGEIDLLEIRRAVLANLPDDPSHIGSQAYWASK